MVAGLLAIKHMTSCCTIFRALLHSSTGKEGLAPGTRHKEVGAQSFTGQGHTNKKHAFQTTGIFKPASDSGSEPEVHLSLLLCNNGARSLVLRSRLGGLDTAVQAITVACKAVRRAACNRPRGRPHFLPHQQVHRSLLGLQDRSRAGRPGAPQSGVSDTFMSN